MRIHRHRPLGMGRCNAWIRTRAYNGRFIVMLLLSIIVLFSGCSMAFRPASAPMLPLLTSTPTSTDYRRRRRSSRDKTRYKDHHIMPWPVVAGMMRNARPLLMAEVGMGNGGGERLFESSKNHEFQQQNADESDMLVISTNGGLMTPWAFGQEDIVGGNATTTTTTTTDVDTSSKNFIEALENEIKNKKLMLEQMKGAEDANILMNKDRFINLCLLIAAFGYAIHTILDVDHGMTRGWTHKEVMLRLPYDNWRNYENSLANSPIWTKTSINVIIYLLGDWLSQTVFNDQNLLDFDATRTFKNGFIGLCFGPLVAEYYEFSDWILPMDVGINRVYKILMDQTIYLFVKCSIYIAVVGLLNGESLTQAKENVSSRIKTVMLTAWKFWPFAHCITYGLIPPQHRILWVNSVDLVWNAILAALSRSSDEHKAHEVTEEKPPKP